MDTIIFTDFLFGCTLGFGVWIAVYLINRSWLGFWGMMR